MSYSRCESRDLFKLLDISFPHKQFQPVNNCLAVEMLHTIFILRLCSDKTNEYLSLFRILLLFLATLHSLRLVHALVFFSISEFVSPTCFTVSIVTFQSKTACCYNSTVMCFPSQISLEVPKIPWASANVPNGLLHQCIRI